MLRNIQRRITVLEKAAVADLKRRRQIVESALRQLEDRHMEPLVIAVRAEREGRALSADESAAKQAYREVLTQECRSNGYSSVAGFEDALDLKLVVMYAMADRIASSMSLQELDLVESAAKAPNKGRAVTPEEAAALQKWMAESNRLDRLAGFDVPADEEAGDQTNVSV